MSETFFEEMKRYVRFGPQDEAALRDLLPVVSPHFRPISEQFYDRLAEHEEAVSVFSGPEQVERLKGTLVEWMQLLFTGPWNQDYYAKRARIGKMHVEIRLPQRYMFGAMDVIRVSLAQAIHLAMTDDHARRVVAVAAVHKILDLELAIMLETYREAFVDKVQHLERLEKLLLERRLAISEARYQEIVDAAEALIVTFDPEGTILLANRRCRELLGRELVGASWFATFVRSEERDRVKDRWVGGLDGGPVPAFEGQVPVVDHELRVRWHLTSLPGAHGRILCAFGLDVTEERQLAARTRRAERLASLGTMAAGLAHEIRNPLNAAHLQLTLLQRRLKRESPDVTQALSAADLAIGEMKRLATLVEEFLQFARPQPLRLSRLDVRAAAEVVVSLVEPEAASLGIELALAPGSPVVTEIDDEKLKQVLHNLVRNAIEATGRGGRVRVRVEQRESSAVIEVEDDGRGLPSTDAPIFEPFFTTKPEGTGLGLAIVHRIIADHGGRVNVESRPGRTVFEIWLPLT